MATDRSDEQTSQHLDRARPAQLLLALRAGPPAGDGAPVRGPRGRPHPRRRLRHRHLRAPLPPVQRRRPRHRGGGGAGRRGQRRSCPTSCSALGEALPYPDDHFDLVFSNEVIEHVDDDRQTAAEMVRVTKPGGAIVTFAPNRLYPFETHGAYLGGRYVFGNIPLVNWLPDPLRDRFAPHVRAYTSAGIRRLFAGQPVRLVHHGVIYPGFDNITARHRAWAACCAGRSTRPSTRRSTPSASRTSWWCARSATARLSVGGPRGRRASPSAARVHGHDLEDEGRATSCPRCPATGRGSRRGPGFGRPAGLLVARAGSRCARWPDRCGRDELARPRQLAVQADAGQHEAAAIGTVRGEEAQRGGALDDVATLEVAPDRFRVERGRAVRRASRRRVAAARSRRAHQSSSRPASWPRAQMPTPARPLLERMVDLGAEAVRVVVPDLPPRGRAGGALAARVGRPGRGLRGVVAAAGQAGQRDRLGVGGRGGRRRCRARSSVAAPASSRLGGPGPPIPGQGQHELLAGHLRRAPRSTRGGEVADCLGRAAVPWSRPLRPVRRKL